MEQKSNITVNAEEFGSISLYPKRIKGVIQGWFQKETHKEWECVKDEFELDGEVYVGKNTNERLSPESYQIIDQC